MTSVDAVYGIGQFDWYWDGAQIVQTDRKTRRVQHFVRSEGD